MVKPAATGRTGKATQRAGPNRTRTRNNTTARIASTESMRTIRLNPNTNPDRKPRPTRWRDTARVSIQTPDSSRTWANVSLKGLRTSHIWPRFRQSNVEATNPAVLDLKTSMASATTSRRLSRPSRTLKPNSPSNLQILNARLNQSGNRCRYWGNISPVSASISEKPGTASR